MGEAPLRIALLSDGQPGHYNQSRGIVAALQHIRPVEVSGVTLKLRMGLMRNLLRRWLNRHRPCTLWPLRLCYGGDALPLKVPDVIVSSGGKTSFASAWLAAVLGVPNVYAGSLRGLSADRFTVVLTLEPLAGADSNLVVPLPPSAVDPERVEQLGRSFRARLGVPDQRYWTLLVGGDGAGYRYTRGDWLTLARLMNTLSARHGIRWLLVTSRRTGRPAETLLKQGVKNETVAAACWCGDGDAYQAEAWLGAAERVLVTEDSMTMLTEAAYALRPVHSLRPVSAAPEPRYEQALQGFLQRGFLCRNSLSELDAQPQLPDLSQCRGLDASPTPWLAEQLHLRLSGSV
jgi:mitochondrial fission protein ELM1